MYIWRLLKGPLMEALKSSPYCGIIGSVACRSTDYEVKWEILDQYRLFQQNPAVDAMKLIRS